MRMGERAEVLGQTQGEDPLNLFQRGARKEINISSTGAAKAILFAHRPLIAN